ncbi:MAG: hypothetical protein V8Q39_00250 [Anaerovoracaceae bacterium]
MSNRSVRERGANTTYAFCLIKDEPCNGFEIKGLTLEEAFHIVKVLQGKKISFELAEEE